MQSILHRKALLAAYNYQCVILLIFHFHPTYKLRHLNQQACQLLMHFVLQLFFVTLPHLHHFFLPAFPALMLLLLHFLFFHLLQLLFFRLTCLPYHILSAYITIAEKLTAYFSLFHNPSLKNSSSFFFRNTRACNTLLSVTFFSILLIILISNQLHIRIISLICKVNK